MDTNEKYELQQAIGRARIAAQDLGMNGAVYVEAAILRLVRFVEAAMNAPPSAVTIPPARTPDDEFDKYAMGWNACRAAMEGKS